MGIKGRPGEGTKPLGGRIALASLGPTVEGETTALYVRQLVTPLDCSVAPTVGKSVAAAWAG